MTLGHPLFTLLISFAIFALVLRWWACCKRRLVKRKVSLNSEPLGVFTAAIIHQPAIATVMIRWKLQDEILRPLLAVKAALAFRSCRVGHLSLL
jgi:hypothetical protein